MGLYLPLKSPLLAGLGAGVAFTTSARAAQMAKPGSREMNGPSSSPQASGRTRARRQVTKEISACVKNLPGFPISLPSQAEKQCHCKTKGGSIHAPKSLTVSLPADWTACHSAVMASPSFRVSPISFKITVSALEGMFGKGQGAHHIRRHCPPSACANTPQVSWCRTSAEAFTVRRAAALYI